MSCLFCPFVFKNMIKILLLGLFTSWYLRMTWLFGTNPSVGVVYAQHFPAVEKD